MMYHVGLMFYHMRAKDLIEGPFDAREIPVWMYKIYVYRVSNSLFYYIPVGVSSCNFYFCAFNQLLFV